MTKIPRHFPRHRIHVIYDVIYDVEWRKQKRVFETFWLKTTQFNLKLWRVLTKKCHVTGETQVKILKNEQKLRNENDFSTSLSTSSYVTRNAFARKFDWKTQSRPEIMTCLFLLNDSVYIYATFCTWQFTWISRDKCFCTWLATRVKFERVVMASTSSTSFSTSQMT